LGNTDPAVVANAIAAVQRENPGFRVDGASWTNDRSWVRGYQSVLGPMEQLSALFHDKTDAPLASSPRDLPLTGQLRYRNALLYTLLLESSDFRYWGQGAWTDYAREIFRRGEAILNQDF
jgi:hypothetical protein